MNARRPTLRAARSWCVLLALASCGEVVTPAAPPEEFDDPFADADARVPAGDEVAVARPVPGDRPAEPVTAAPGVVAPADAPAGPAASATPPAAADAAGTPPAAADAAGTPLTAVADAAGTPPGPGPAVTADKKPAKKSTAAPKHDAPVPANSPAPTPAPAPAPTPEPAPVTTPTPAPVEKPAPPAVPPQQRFAGTYRFAGGDAQRQNLEAAIEATAMQLNALIRGIGRKRLRESNPIREQISIAVDGDRVSMTFGPGRTVTGRLEGPSVAWTSDSGKPVQVTFSLVKGRLVQTFTAEDGGRRSVYTLDETGDRLTLSVTITSERLGDPLKYALTYRRT